jgi:hypothetical protein
MSISTKISTELPPRHNINTTNLKLNTSHQPSQKASGPGIRDLTGSVKPKDKYAAAVGGFGDVYVGAWERSDGASIKVGFTIVLALGITIY